MSALLLLALLSGRLCIGGQCSDYTCGDTVAATQTARTFTLSRGDARLMGTLTAGETRIACDADGALQVRVRLAERSKAERVNVRVLVTSSGGAAWQVEAGEHPITLKMPRGDYEIAVEAPHYVSYRAKMQVADANAALTAELRPLRTIEGIVVDRVTRAAIAGAKIAAAEAGETATARNGRFALEVDPVKWPKQITVRAANYGTRIVSIPQARANTTLDEIALASAATVAAQIHQTEPGQVAKVELMRLEHEGRVPGATVQTQTLPASVALERSVRFENVEPGLYVVMAAGAKPSQRAGERVEVRDGDPPAVHVHLMPYQLRLRPLFEDAPLRKGHVVLRQFSAFWEIPADTDAHGEATLELWQAGRMSVTVGGAGALPYRAWRTIADPIDTDWTIEMPRFAVDGRVVDADSGAPIPNAHLVLDMSSPTVRQMMVSSTADGEGTFRFAPVVPGTHKITAAAKGYPPTMLSYELGEKEESHSITVALRRTPAAQLAVLDARGAPLDGAEVYVFQGERLDYVMRTVAGTRAPIFIPEGEVRDVFVLPREGSLGVMRISSGNAEQTIFVADGTSRIVIRTESESNAPIADMPVDFAYNGLLLPPDIHEALRRAGSRTESGSDGRIVLEHMPPGTYEVWPIPRGLRYHGVATRAPLRLNALPGENVAVMTFARAK